MGSEIQSIKGKASELELFKTQITSRVDTFEEKVAAIADVSNSTLI